MEHKNGLGVGDTEAEQTSSRLRTENHLNNENDPKQAPRQEARPIFVIRLRPEVGVDGARALRRALKVLLRRFRLQCVDIREERAK
jgi:hypothetical protein